MCGIFSFILKRPLNKKDILLGREGKKMLKHRGPDSDGEWYNKKEGVYLGHTRLSIIDLSLKGNQPMINNKHVLAYNGEIYNFLEIKKELEVKGIKFCSNSDTEVLLKYWQNLNNSCLNYLDGMFAFVIWNGKNIWISRDKFGEKQLFYATTKDGVYISSEIYPLVKLLKKEKDLNNEKLAAYLALGYVPSPYTAYKNIFCVEPATAILLKKGVIKKKFNYSENINHKELVDINENYIDDINNEIIKSVKSRLYSDAKKCLFLSSGIDSSLLASIISKELKNNIHTITVGFGKSKSLDETKEAKKIANYLKLPHQIIPCKLDDKKVDTNYLLTMYGQPNDNLTIIPTYQMALIAKKLKYKVGITGMGGDEISSGYRKQTFIKKYKNLYAMPEKLRLFISFILKPLNNYNSKIEIFRNIFGVKNEFLYIALKNTNLISQLKEIPYMEEWAKKNFSSFNGNNLFKSVENFDFKNVMPNSRLITFDHGGMRAGYEFRSPYLNSNLISLFSASKFKYNKYKTQKFIFRKILERYLPKKLIFGFKKGFVYPFEDFLQKNKKYSSDSITNNLKEKKLNQNPSWTRFLVRKEIVNDFLKS